jgi:hypothetical protein
VSLEADIRVENTPPNRVRVPGRTRHASPWVATFLHGEADVCVSAERIGIGFDDHLRGANFPGVACSFGMILTDPHLAFRLDIGVLQER